MSERGLTLVELLVAMLITMAVAGGALMLTRAARIAFTVEPAIMDTVRRLREGADVLAAAILSAGGDRGIGDDNGALAAVLPVVRLAGAADEDSFDELVVIRSVQGGRGRLTADQPGPAGSLTLDMADGLCARSGAVCGFSVGDVAVAFDGRGHFDVFIVAAVSEPLARITPRVSLNYAYRAGSWVTAIRHERFALQPQPGGAGTLTRITAAGAREPILEGVTRLRLWAWADPIPPRLHVATDRPGFAQYGLAPPRPDAVDPEGIYADGAHCTATPAGGVLQTALVPLGAQDEGLARLGPSELEDGPWCPHDDAPDRYDADWFRVRRVDVELQVEVQAAEFRGPAGPLFARAGTGVHDAPRWVRDRAVQFSAAVSR